MLQTVHCGNVATLQRLVAAPEVRSVAFTGSLAGGLAVQQAAAAKIIPVGLELGGNDPAYVRADVDVAWAAAEIVDGAVFNSGQSCCAIERVYVHADIYDAFLAEVVKVLEGYRLGDPFDPATQVGPVVSPAAAAAIAAHVRDAVDKGARVLTPDVFGAGTARGVTFVRPELLADCNHSMRVMVEETFGPVIAVARVASDEDAVKHMNDSDLGLTASVWTKDVATAERLVERIDAGTVFVNRCDYPSPVCAPGGIFGGGWLTYGRISRGWDGRTVAGDRRWVDSGSMRLCASRASTSRTIRNKGSCARRYARWSAIYSLVCF